MQCRHAAYKVLGLGWIGVVSLFFVLSVCSVWSHRGFEAACAYTSPLNIGAQIYWLVLHMPGLLLLQAAKLAAAPGEAPVRES